MRASLTSTRPPLARRCICPSAAPRRQATDIAKVAWEPLTFTRSGNRSTWIVLTNCSVPRSIPANDEFTQEMHRSGGAQKWRPSEDKGIGCLNRAREKEKKLMLLGVPKEVKDDEA